MSQHAISKMRDTNIIKSIPQVSFVNCYGAMNYAPVTQKSLTDLVSVPNDRNLRFFVVLCIVAPGLSLAQIGNVPASPTGDHPSFWNRFWVSMQANFIRQQHPAFDAKYS